MVCPSQSPRMDMSHRISVIYSLLLLKYDKCNHHGTTQEKKSSRPFLEGRVRGY